MADEQQLRLMDIVDWPLNEVNAFVVLGKGQVWETRILVKSVETSTGGGFVINDNWRGGVFTGLEPVEIGYGDGENSQVVFTFIDDDGIEKPVASNPEKAMEIIQKQLKKKSEED